MRAIRIWLTLLLLWSGLLSASDKPVVNVVFLNFAGYSERSESGEVVGKGVDVVRKLFQEAGYPIEISLLPAARIWRGLENGSIHAWPGIANKPGLEQHTLQTERDIGGVGIQLYYRPGEPQPRWPEDLVNKSVITITNFTYTTELRNLLNEPQRNLVIHKSGTNVGAVQMLLWERGDYLLDYRSQVGAALHDLGMTSLPSVPIIELPMRFLLSRHSGFAEQLKVDLDAAHDRLLERGEDIALPLL